MLLGVLLRCDRAVIGRDLAGWFRKRVAAKLSKKIIPDAAGAVNDPIREAGGIAKRATEAIPDQDLMGRRQIDVSGLEPGKRPGPEVLADRTSTGGDLSHAGTPNSKGAPAAPTSSAAAGKYTADSRRAWFRRQFDEGNLDPENLAAAKVVIMDEHGRVLMLQSPYERKRTMPGDFVDNGPRKREQPEDAARREVREELGEEIGKTVRIERLLATNRKSADPGHGRDHPLTDYIYLATFDASAGTGVSGMKFDVDEKEVTGFDFLAPEEAIESAGRKGIDVSAALEAHSAGATIHLVDGEPPSLGKPDDRADPG